MWNCWEVRGILTDCPDSVYGGILASELLIKGGPIYKKVP